MANLIDVNKWTIINGSRNGEEFVLVNGKMSQAITFPGDETKYRLEFNCGTLTDLKSYFLLKIVALEGKHTYLIPVMFLGENIIEMELIKDIKTISIVLVGSLSVSNIAIYENGVLTEEQKTSIDKVTNESDKWDRIDKVTNEQGNLITGRLEGSINNALNTIFGGNGTMEMIDGTIIFRDKDTDANSTMAMRLNFGGLAIADSKKADGSWDWKTFGTGQGFTADYMNTGTLSAITIDGVTITGTHIVGGTIEGAHISAGILDARQAQVIGLEVGSNITMGPNATIGWQQVQQKPGNLATTDQIPTIPSYIESTKITKTTIESPNISGSTITGGTITGTIIKGGTITAGQEEGYHTILNTTRPFGVYYGTKDIPVALMWGNRSNPGENANISLRDLQGREAFYISGPASLGAETMFQCMYDGKLKIIGDTRVVGLFTASDKRATVNTEHFGWRQLYCDESDIPTFATKGIGETTAENKHKCIIRLDEVFLETIEPNSINPYFITFNSYSKSRVWIKSIYDKYIIFESEEATKFSYEIRNIRKGYLGQRLPEVGNIFRGSQAKDDYTLRKKVN